MDIAELYTIYNKYPSVTTDSRNTPKDSIFFALRGENFNGNQFAEEALNKGCAYAIVDEWEGEPSIDSHIIKVSDVLKTLAQLANYHRKKLKIPVIAITGTNGKTTTKELIATILSKEYKVAYTQGNLNNHIGVPLTLLSMNKSHEIAVVEMGANHMYEIKQLCEIAEPDYGLITNIGKAHLEGFGSFDNLVKTKKELYDFLNENKGKVFVNKDNDQLFEMTEGMDRILYGRNDPSLFASVTIAESTPFLEFDWRFFDKPYRVKTHLVGEYNLDNALAAIAIGKFFGVNAQRISNALEEYEPKNNRSQFERTEKNDLIIDAYNANPTSMKASLDFFIKIPSDMPKAVILGEMKELGELTVPEHLVMLMYLNEQKFDKIFLVGNVFIQLSESVSEKYQVFETVEDLIKELEDKPIIRHYIFLKGSRSIHLEKVIPYL